MQPEQYHRRKKSSRCGAALFKGAVCRKHREGWYFSHLFPSLCFQWYTAEAGHKADIR